MRRFGVIVMLMCVLECVCVYSSIDVHTYVWRSMSSYTCTYMRVSHPPVLKSWFDYDLLGNCMLYIWYCPSKDEVHVMVE